MTYQIKTEAGKFQVVLTVSGGASVIRVLNTFANRADAEQLLTDLSGWKL